MRHMFLNAEIMNRRIEMQRRSHSHRRQIRRSMEARTHLIEFRKVRCLLQVSDSASMHQRHPQIVDPLISNQIMCIPDGIENLTHSNRRGRMLPDYLKAFLQFCWRRIFHPKEMEWLKLLPQPTGLNRCQPVVAVMKKMQFLAKLLSHPSKQTR